MLDQRAHCSFVAWVGIRMQEADRDRLDPVIDQLPHRRSHLVSIERGYNAAVTVQPLADF